MFIIKVAPLHSRLERQFSNQEVVGSSPTVRKNFSCCNSGFLHVPNSWTKQLRMKSTVAYT